METKRILEGIDKQLLAAIVALMVIGIVLIASATHALTPGEDDPWYYVIRQGIFVLFNLGLMVYFLRYDYRMLRDAAGKLYFLNIVMLLLVMFFGTTALGAQRWLRLGPVMVQPSEFAKAIMIIAMAAFIEPRLNSLYFFNEWLPVFGYMLVPFLFVLRQPDLGTSLVFLAILLGMMFICGFRRRYFLIMAGCSLAAAPLLWRFLHEYQRNRIRVFLNPGLEPYGSGYHVIQSIIAIGSGLLGGRGLFHGTQSQLSFLPENHTDFVFAVLGEECGFIGVVVVLGLYLFIILRGLSIARQTKDDFGSLLAIGIISMLAFHVLVNVGMTSGIMPVTGITLPFVSYGVSSLTTNMFLMTVLLNIDLHNRELSFK